MPIAPDGTQQGSPHYRAMRELVEQMDDRTSGKFEITKQRIVHDLRSPSKPHELTALRLRRRLESLLPEGRLAHTGAPDVEDVAQGVLRLPDIIVIDEADMEGEGSFDPRTLIADWTVSTEGLPRYDAGTS
ncbi:hypothetical protein GPA10_02880 [Streptomyces sp. p1417]|uniref:Uncharacterized protein n=1 Tax=Streptomyces typhae TaxID=2681492 RepID=A0A6L6WTN9_9ACTN|nr:hypothetical protein [Streptomyces typhae]MVO83736.1 hypothetical protein [Streptomyces typhae]